MLEFPKDILKQTNLRHLQRKQKITHILAKDSTLYLSDGSFIVKIPLSFLNAKEDYFFYILLQNAPKVSDLLKGFSLENLKDNFVRLMAGDKEFIGIPPQSDKEKVVGFCVPNAKYSYTVDLDSLKILVNEMEEGESVEFCNDKVIVYDVFQKEKSSHIGVVKEEQLLSPEPFLISDIKRLRKKFLEYILKLNCDTIDLRPDGIFQVKMDIFARS